MTWNLETFPKNGQQTIDDVSRIFEALDVDNEFLQDFSDQIDFVKIVAFNIYEKIYLNWLKINEKHNILKYTKQLTYFKNE